MEGIHGHIIVALTLQVWQLARNTPHEDWRAVTDPVKLTKQSKVHYFILSLNVLRRSDHSFNVFVDYCNALTFITA